MTNQEKVPAAEILDLKDCWRLFREASVGRLAITVNGHPDVFPYKVDGESLVFRTGSGTKQEALDADPVIAFEVDRVRAEFGLAWSIVVRGNPKSRIHESGSRLHRLRLVPLARNRKRLSGQDCP